MRFDLRLPILVKDDTFEQHIEKLQEEVSELIEELRVLHLHPDKKQAVKVLSEALDNMQVIIGVIDNTAERFDIKLKDAEFDHVTKLYSRGWNFKKFLRLKED